MDFPNPSGVHSLSAEDLRQLAIELGVDPGLPRDKLRQAVKEALKEMASKEDKEKEVKDDSTGAGASGTGDPQHMSELLQMLQQTLIQQDETIKAQTRALVKKEKSGVETQLYKEANRRNLTFSGNENDNILRFLKEFKALALACKASADDTLFVLKDCFRGSAKLWLDVHAADHHTWQSLEDEIKLEFRAIEFEDRLRLRIRARTQGQSERVSSFVSTIRKMNQDLSDPIPEAALVRIILRNLNPKYSSWVRKSTATTMVQLEALCREAEGVFADQNAYKPPPQAELTDPVYGVPGTTSSHLKVAEATVEEPQVDAMRIPGPRKCFNCQEPGHTFANCSKARGLFCYNCGKHGVTSTLCDCKHSQGASGVTVDSVHQMVLSIQKQLNEMKVAKELSSGNASQGS